MVTKSTKNKTKTAAKALRKQTRRHVSILDRDDFALALVSLDTDYSRFSNFYNSDRRTGHRWLQKGPSDFVARLIQLCLSLGLTLEQARYLIDQGVVLAGGGGVPEPVINLGPRVAKMLRTARSGDHHATVRPARSPTGARHRASQKR